MKRLSSISLWEYTVYIKNNNNKISSTRKTPLKLMFLRRQSLARQRGRAAASAAFVFITRRVSADYFGGSFGPAHSL